MKALIFVLLVGCGSTQAVSMADKTVIELSHDVLRAYDRGDAAHLDGYLATSFVHIDGADTTTRTDDLKVQPGQVFPLIAKRAWTGEQVFASTNVRIFRGLADEQQAGNEVHGNYHFSGWYTLVWVREHDAWRVGMLTWNLSGHETEDNWNAIYRNHVGFTTEPNKLLVATVAGVPPGRALDVATGQGRNGLYLASLGWKVTGVDFAMEALREAGEQAAAKKLDYEPVYANLASYDFGIEKWNLVDMIYTPDHPEWIEKIKPSIQHGGLFVLEFFARDAKSQNGTELSALEKAFTGWEISRHEVVEDTPDWAENRAALVRFVAKKP
jgi:SAM-dependent methyltransferase